MILSMKSGLLVAEESSAGADRKVLEFVEVRVAVLTKVLTPGPVDIFQVEPAVVFTLGESRGEGWASFGAQRG